jgi:hypothetical protein
VAQDLAAEVHQAQEAEVDRDQSLVAVRNQNQNPAVAQNLVAEARVEVVSYNLIFIN